MSLGLTTPATFATAAKSALAEEFAQVPEESGMLLQCGERCAGPNRIVAGLGLLDTLPVCCRVKIEGDASGPAASGGIGQSSMSQIARNSSLSVTLTAAS